MGDTENSNENGNQPMGTPYEKDVVAWAYEQAALLRAGKLASIDIEHIAEEIEDVGKSEQREFASRMAVLLAHLLKWQFQPERRGNSWTNTILRSARGNRATAQENTQSEADARSTRTGSPICGAMRAQQAANEMRSDSPICPKAARGR